MLGGSVRGRTGGRCRVHEGLQLLDLALGCCSRLQQGLEPEAMGCRCRGCRRRRRSWRGCQARGSLLLLVKLMNLLLELAILLLELGCPRNGVEG